jgi:hypothetical protein
MVLPLASMRSVYQVPVATGRDAAASTVMVLPFMYCSSTRLALVSASRYILVELATRDAKAAMLPVPAKASGLTRACTE